MTEPFATPLRPGLVEGPNHSVVVVDVNTPMASGAPVFAGVWQAMGMP